MKEVGCLVGLCLLCLLVFVLGLMAIAYPFRIAGCDAQWTDFVHRYDVLGGCLVQYEGTWYPDDVVRSIIQ